LEDDPFAGGDLGNASASDPFGAQAGSMGNLVFTDEKVRVGFIGEKRPYDVWASDFTLDVSSTAASVMVEKTTDTRFQPPEEVVKITVKDKATGMESVYFLHDVGPNTKIKINTPGGQKVTDPAALATVGEYKKPSAASDVSESSHPVETLDNGNLLVEAPLNEVIELTSAGNGEDQVWEIYGNYNLSVRPSDIVVVTRTGKNPDTYTIEVTHRQGDKDTYLIQAGSEGNLNAIPEKVSFVDATASTGTRNVHGVDVVNVNDLTLSDGSESSDPEVKVPDGWENLTLNGGSSETAPEDLKGDQPTSMEDGKRVYDGEDFNISPIPSGENEETRVDASGTVTITPNSNSEYFTLSFENGQFVLKVYADSARSELKETIRIDATLVKKLDLNIDPSRVKFEGDIPSDYQDKLYQEGAVSQALADVAGNEKNRSDIEAKAAEMGIDLNNPPQVPDAALFEFLYQADSVLKDLLEQATAEDVGDKWDGLVTQIRDRIVELLRAIYPAVEVGPGQNGNHDGDDIAFGNREYDIMDQDKWEANMGDPWSLLRLSTSDT
jgi:hypothetical protein